jgi:hypothetical protein
MLQKIIIDTADIPEIIKQVIHTDKVAITTSGNSITISPEVIYEQNTKRVFHSMGIAAKYANPALSPLEKDAPGIAAAEKFLKKESN